jgi:hypothetical protein
VNLLARYSSAPTMRHWQGLKHILRYLSGTRDFGLYYQHNHKDSTLVGYSDAGLMSDPVHRRSQSGYCFMMNGAAISWASRKQSMTVDSSFEAELIALRTASQECIWLRDLISELQCATPLKVIDGPTTMFEDNSAVVKQIHSGVTRTRQNKHIEAKYWATKDLHGSVIDLQFIGTEKNIADLFTKTLGASRHWDLCKLIGLRSLEVLNSKDGN